MMYLVHQLFEAKRWYCRDESGATAIEYGMLAAGISVVIIATVFELGPVLNTAFTTVLNELQGAGTSP